MLQTRADCKGVSLETVKIDPVLSDLDIMPDADLQRQNASLAIALASLVLQKIGSNSLMKSTPSSFIRRGLENTVWCNRCVILPLGNVTWHLDGANSVDSLRVAGHWFAGLAQDSPRILILTNSFDPRPPLFFKPYTGVTILASGFDSTMLSFVLTSLGSQAVIQQVRQDRKVFSWPKC